MSLPDLPNITPELLDISRIDKLAPAGNLSHPPRILMLYGSLRERSFSRFLTEEAARIQTHFSADVRIFDPTRCRWWAACRKPARRSLNCAGCACDPKARSGAVRSAMARSPP